MHKEAGHTVENAVEARGAFRDRPTLVVLTASVILVVVLFGAAYLGVFGT